MTNSEAEKRSLERVPVDLIIQFELLIPEHTFRSKLFDGHVSNLSERGAMVSVDLDRQTGSSLLQSTRYCRIWFSEMGLPQRVVGKALWIQEKVPLSEDTDRYRIGIYFENCPEEHRAELCRYVAKLLSQQHRA